MIDTRVDIGFQAVEFAPLASVYHCDGHLAFPPRLCLDNWHGN
jgi:hypothetical protein